MSLFGLLLCLLQVCNSGAFAIGSQSTLHSISKNESYFVLQWQRPSQRSRTPSMRCFMAKKDSLEGAGSLPQVPAWVYTLNSSTKWIVTVAHTLSVWARPRAFGGPFIVVGSVAAVYLSDFLKKVINQGRPAGAPFADPGMPSSHSLVTYFSAVAWISMLGSSRAANAYTMERALLLSAATLVAMLRVICGYHSLAQIAVGAVIGSFLGQLWFLLGEVCRVANPRLALLVSWYCYLGGSILFISKNMRDWVDKDANL